MWLWLIHMHVGCESSSAEGWLPFLTVIGAHSYQENHTGMAVPVILEP